MRKINIILKLEDKIDPKEYGNKAQSLSWLAKNELKVPKSIFLPKSIDLTNQSIKDEIIKEILPFLDNNLYNVAIRSSSSAEDTGEESKAGHFISELGLFSIDELFTKIELVQNSGYSTGINENIGVIIQSKIDPLFSGIAFSSHPVSKSKLIGLITYVKGSNEQLTSGNEEGKEIELKFNGDSVNFEKSDINSEKIKEIALTLKKLENMSKIPIDIEWALDQENNLFLLQCRPMTGIFFKERTIFPIDNENEKFIPISVKNNDKIKIRLLADKYNVRASKAHLFLINNLTKFPNIPKEIEIARSEYCKSYSTVILYPSTHQGEIQRLFATLEINDKNFMRYCHRYGVRAIDNANSVNASLYKLVDLVKDEYWTTVIILQEFYDSDYSGIIKKLNDGYLVEIAKGQFIAKGILQPTKYVFDFNLNLLEKNEIDQTREVNIIDGEIEENEYDKPVLVSFSENEAKTIVREFKPILDNQDSIIEFALLKNDEKKVIPYLYDLVDDDSTNKLSFNDINSGILSPGELTGKLEKLKDFDNLNENLHLHFHNETNNVSVDQENIVFYTKMPSISLLKLLNLYDNNKIAFIFERGSILAHFSIVLREKKIPAILLNSKINLDEGQIVKIDAITAGLDAQQRIGN